MPERHLQDAMATALSLDYWTAPEESLCAYHDPRLSVNFLCMDQVANERRELNAKTSIKRAARFQEIFLDLTGWHASRRSSSRFFLDDRFHSNLEDDDRELKDDILALLDRPSRESTAYKALLSRLQEDFGLGDLNEALQRRRDRKSSVRKMRSMSSMSFGSQKKPPPDSDATTILQKGIDLIKEDPNLKRAAAMIGTSDVSYRIEDIKDFLDRFPVLDHLSAEEFMQLVVSHAHRDVRAEFFELFEIPSHVFVCNSSVCELACDAFLCPVASIAYEELSGVIWKRWQEQIEETNVNLWHQLIGGRQNGHVRFDRYGRVAVPTRWPRNCSQPLILPTEVLVLGDDEDLQIKELMKSAREFLDVAYNHVKDKAPQNGRERHLLALPVIGTGGGGARDMTGEIVKNLFHILDEFVSRHKVDCVIVAADEATYAHAQKVREEPPSSILSPEKLKAAEDLAQLAASGHLSLFLGAGTSIPSGLPSWKGLLYALEDQLTSSRTTGKRKIERECGGDLLKMADKLADLARSHANGKCLKTRVANHIEEQKCHPSLVLALLLSLPSKSIVTTNYDKLIETAYHNQNVASSDRSRASDLSILPHQPISSAKKWLLKMHGCVSHPKKIVLSGKDYAESKVLTGIVQANLLTTHLLFCGFSLTDPNYEKVVKEVRAALHGDRDLDDPLNSWSKSSKRK